MENTPPTLIFYYMEGKFDQIITKLRVSIKKNNNCRVVSLTNGHDLTV